MKNKPVIITMLGSFLLSLVAISNVAAEETRWINTHKFIAGENVILSHGSPVYPGSIVIQPVDTAEPSEIITRFKIKKEYELTSVTICVRDNAYTPPTSPDDIITPPNYINTPPFAMNIWKLGVPVDEGFTVEMDDLVFSDPESTDPPTLPDPPEGECTVIVVDPAIQATDETLLLGLSFDFPPTTPSVMPAIISAVGLGETSKYLMIEDCNTFVSDIAFDRKPFYGLPLSDVIAQCEDDAKNHGKYVSCVSKAANVLKKAKLISGKEKGQITRCAAQSDIPAK